jgi:hypothetical protein
MAAWDIYYILEGVKGGQIRRGSLGPKSKGQNSSNDVMIAGCDVLLTRD